MSELVFRYLVFPWMRKMCRKNLNWLEDAVYAWAWDHWDLDTRP